MQPWSYNYYPGPYAAGRWRTHPYSRWREMQLSNWIHLILVVIHKQEHQWNPPFTNCNIQSLILFKMTERRNICMQYSVPNEQPFSLFVLDQKIMLVNCLMRHTLMKSANNLRWWLIRLQCVSIFCQPLSVVLTGLQNPVNHRCRNVWSTHQALQDPHGGNSRVLVAITRTVIVATSTRSQ